MGLTASLLLHHILECPNHLHTWYDPVEKEKEGKINGIQSLSALQKIS